MPNVCIRGVSHSYSLVSTEKAGPAIVFVHGWLLSQGYWEPLINRLKAFFPCLTYDLRGFGASSCSQEQYIPAIPEKAQRLGATLSPFGLPAYADDLENLLQQLNLNQVWLVGHSLGASIALWTAYCYPQRVQGVICLNAGGGVYIQQDFERFRKAGAQIVRFRPSWLCHLPLVDLVFTRMMVARPLDRQWGRLRLLDLIRADTDAALGTLLESTTEAEVHLLPRIMTALQQPVHFIAGEADQVMAPRFVDHLASFHRQLPLDRSTVKLPQCGHMAMVECPDTVASLIYNIATSSATPTLSAGN